MNLHEWLTARVAEAAAAADTPAAVRRCEADRRILDRHKPWSSGSTECDGCDQDLTTDINDCPELLDLAHAHGITGTILASLDRPEPPPQPQIDLRRVQARADAIHRLRTATPARLAPATFRPASPRQH